MKNKRRAHSGNANPLKPYQMVVAPEAAIQTKESVSVERRNGGNRGQEHATNKTENSFLQYDLNSEPNIGKET